MSEIEMLQMNIMELEKIRAMFLIYKQNSDEQFQMFDNEMTDLKVKLAVQLKELEEKREAWANREAENAA